MTPNLSKPLQLFVILGSGLIGALAAKQLGLPIPFLLGSLIVTAALALTLAARTGQRLIYPKTMREFFVAVIGTMIGSTFTPEIFAMAPILGITFAAMIVFVALAQGVNFVIFRRLGGYDRATAQYAAMPGGLIEAIELGEKAGGDVETLSIQHFIRIVLVIVVVPLLFLIITGETHGSASGQTLESGPTDWQDWALFLLIAPVGLMVGQRLRLPAAPLLGPLAIAAVLQATGTLDLQAPLLLLNVAQLIVGATLGSRFANSTPRRLIIALGLGAVSVGVTLGIASGLAFVLSHWVPVRFQTLLISFAPGGITEMSLIALSLGVSPVLVSSHHLFRILFTVAVAVLVSKRRK